MILFGDCSHVEGYLGGVAQFIRFNRARLTRVLGESRLYVFNGLSNPAGLTAPQAVYYLYTSGHRVIGS